MCKRGGIRAVGIELDMRSGRNDQLLVQHTPRDSPGLRDAFVRQCLCIVKQRWACGKFERPKISGSGVSIYIYMRIGITNEHVTHLVMSRSLHVLAIYGFVVVVVVVVVVVG